MIMKKSGKSQNVPGRLVFKSKKFLNGLYILLGSHESDNCLTIFFDKNRNKFLGPAIKNRRNLEWEF